MNGPRPELPGRIQVGPCWRDHMEGKAPRVTWRETEEAQAEARDQLWARGEGLPALSSSHGGGKMGPRHCSGLGKNAEKRQEAGGLSHKVLEQLVCLSKS